jgi:two-component system, cell cycle sensor histidine kinase and response regulator CckA
LARVRERSIVIVVFFAFVGIIVIIANSTILNRLLNRRILELGKGIEIIGAGDLEYRIDAQGDDELSALARGGNEMAGKLKMSHTSVKNLQQEITERKQAEETIRQSERKLSLHMKQTMFAVIEWDAEFLVKEWNPAATTIFGYTREEAIGRHATEIIIPRNIGEDIGKVFNHLLAKVGGFYNTNENVTKDGRVIVCEWFNTPMIDERGTVTGAISFALDITERRKASEKLARLGMAVDQAAEAIIIADREGTILYVNPAFERISGYSREESVGKTTRILRSGEQDKSLYQEMWGTLERGEVWTGHLNNRRKDGSLYEEDATISPVRDSSGNVVSFVGVMRDVTQLLSLEKQVRTAQKMEAVGTLAGGIAHDFNNALTGIVGFGELLRMRMAGDEQALHDLDEILRCAERAATLTRQLLTFARRQVIEPVNLNLSVLVADLMKLVGKVVGEHIEVKTSMGRDLPTIHADRGQIEQVVMNLCLNARDAMPEGGRLVVETGDVVLNEEYVRQYPYMRTGRYALLTVSDTGVGMDEKTCERVFEPFFTTKGPDKGTGLGLAMVYGIVKQHGGFILVDSKPGKGTTFKVYFPAIEAQPDAVPVKRGEEIVRGGTETILLAEDEEAIRALAERILTGFGYTVLVARNGEEAVGIFRRKKEIVLAVLDVVMPQKGGKEAFEEMHRQDPRLKVIYMSGYSADGIHDSFVLTPGTPFLQKPFGSKILARKVREVLDTQ